MNRPAVSVPLILLGVVGIELLRAERFVAGMLVILVVGTAAHFLTRPIQPRPDEPEKETESDRPENGERLVWSLIAISGLLLPILRLLGVSPVWIHLDAAAFFVLSLLPVLRIAGRDGFAARWRRRWPLLPILLLALTVGGYALDRIPETVHGDEGEMGCRARAVIEGQVKDLFVPYEWYSIPNFFFGVAAASLYLFGNDLFGLRMHVLLMGLGAVFFTYLAAERLWGRRSAVYVSLILVGNHFFIHLMRCAVGYGQATFFLAAIFYFFVRAYQDQKYAWVHFGGVLIGLSCLSYQANHIHPVLWGMLFVFAWIVRQTDWRFLLKAVLGGYVATVVVLSPLLLAVKKENVPFLDRARQVVVGNEGSMIHLDTMYRTGGKRTEIWREQFKRALFAPTAFRDTSMQYKGPAPMFGRLAGALLMIGAIMAVWSVRDGRLMFPVLCALSILVVGGALTIDTPFYPRLAGVPPVLALIAGRTLDRLLSSGNAEEEKADRGSRVGIAAIVLGAIFVTNLHLYFRAYHSDWSSHYTLTAMAREIAEQEPGTVTYFVVPPKFYFDLGTIRFLAPNQRGIDVENPIELIPRLPEKSMRPLFFIISEQHRDAIPMIRDRFPNGEIKNHFRRDGVHIFTSIAVPANA